MRKRRGGMSTLTVGLVALVVTVIGVYLGFTKSIPFRSHYEVKAAFKSANNIRRGSPVRIAGVEVGKVTKIERGHEGDEGAVLTMRIQDKGRPLHPDAHFKIRPRIFLEGNFFVDVTPGTSSREVADGHTFPVQQTDTPVQLDQVLTALQSDTREDLKTALREYVVGPQGQGRQGLQRLDQVLEARLPRLGDRLRGDARREGARPLRLHRPRRRRRRRARPPPRAAQGPDHELPRHGGRVRAREHATSRPRSPSCRARCAPPSPRSPRSTARSRACAASPATSARASRTPRRRSTSRCRCSSSCAGSSRSRSCAA